MLLDYESCCLPSLWLQMRPIRHRAQIFSVFLSLHVLLNLTEKVAVPGELPNTAYRPLGTPRALLVCSSIQKASIETREDECREDFR